MSRRLSELSLKDIDTIIFDFGGVLFDIDYDLPVKAFRDFGVPGFDELYKQSKQSDLFDLLETGKISQSDFLNELRRILKTELPDEKLLEAWNVILLDIPKERIDHIYKLKEQFQTLLLSNTNAIHVEVFEKRIDEKMGLDYFYGAFEKVYYSNQIGIRKPHPETFLEICKWHKLNPSRTLFIDDSKQHVEGAREAGLQAYHLEVDKEDIRELGREIVHQ
ncbi:HAD family hydrolase [Halocola ammonii]